MRKHILFALLLGFVLPALAQGLIPQPETFVYAIREGNDTLRLDLYKPAVARGDGACVVFLHGGAFAWGGRDDTLSRTFCRTLCDKGFIAVSVDYRLMASRIDFKTLRKTDYIPTLDTILQCATEDCAAALTFVARHAAEWGADTARLILSGSSAGAITALQTDYCRANALPWTSCMPAGLRPAAVVSYSGAVFSRRGAIRYDSQPSPTCLFHGTDDHVVTPKRIRFGKNCFEGSFKLAETLEEAGATYHLFRAQHLAHDVSQMCSDLIEEFVSFVDMVLRHRTFGYTTDCYRLPPLDDPDYYKSLSDFTK